MAFGLLFILELRALADDFSASCFVLRILNYHDSLSAKGRRLLLPWSASALIPRQILSEDYTVSMDFKFPTHLEQSLWRSTSVAITAIPLIVARIDFLLAARLRIRDINFCPRFEKFALLTLDLVMAILLFVYVPVRLSLIAQALALLRSQPASVLSAVDWTKYVPHLFSS